MTNVSAPRPLDGLLVAETGARTAVGACGSLLAQLGATVVVLEPRRAATRGKWAHRARVMAGKWSINIDQDRQEDQRLAEALLERADVVLASPDMPDYGWARSDLRETTQVAIDLTAFGRDAPYRTVDDDEPRVQAFCGVVDTTGPVDGPPVIVGVPVLEMSAAIYAAGSVLLARRVAQERGGQRVDIALADVGISFLANFLSLSFAGQPATRSGNRHPLYMPWGCYRARDGHLLVCAVSDEQFARLAQGIGKPWLTSDQRFTTPAGRLRNCLDLDTEIIQWACDLDLDACEQTLRDAGIPCGRIVTMKELEQEPNLVHRRAQRTIVDPCTDSDVRVVLSPLLDPSERGTVDVRVPKPGADRDAVLALLAQQGTMHVAKDGATHGPPTQPLAGVRIVEIGHYTVAPFATRLLGAFGADVIKVEPPRGEAIRFGPPLRHDGMSYIFALSNTDKRGVVLDLTSATDRDMLHRLLAQSDVLIENLRPGALERLGFGSDVLRKRHPQLVYCAMTGFGRDSVYRERPALDSVIQAMSGFMSQTLAGSEPMKAGISASDSIGGLFGMLAMLVGLEQRDRHGVPAPHFDLSMQDASAWVSQMAADANPCNAPRVMQAADGYVVIGALDKLSGIDFAASSRADVVNQLQARGESVASVQTIPEVLTHPYVAARGMLVQCECPQSHPWTVLKPPMRFDHSGPVVGRTLGPLGTDQASIVAELGLASGDPHDQRGAVPRVPA